METDTDVYSRYREICIKYARHLVPSVMNELNKIQDLKDFTTLMETTLRHDFTLNGTPYDEALTEVLIPWVYERNLEILKHILEDSVPVTIYKAAELGPINTDQDPYIHTALQILKSLTNCPNRNFWPGSLLYYHYSGKSGKFVVNQEWRYIHISNYVRLCMGKAVKSGKITKFERELRLKNLQPGIREHILESKNIYEWNRNLVLEFLIPILDLCPKSDKLRAVINRRARRAALRYTPRRRLRDAVYRYIRRTSEVGNN